ncbi:MAG: SDR family NAD(P)-dependent oxidoreductase [Candidatus Neptunochlamydia sp.]|nr:SDR family NAD(P)-dependent oxidoreductase [Candidatus Neptunochlamydia sp.]
MNNRFEKPSTLWMFTGQGSLKAGDAKTLYQERPHFKDTLDTYISILSSSIDLPLLELLINPKSDQGKLLEQTQYGQPALIAFQLAQISLWNSMDKSPDVVLGHSIGEFSAAVAAHVMEPEEALRLSVIRGKLMSECPKGGMVAVFSSVDMFQSLPKDIVIAAENDPQMTVLAGPTQSLQSYIHSLNDINHTFLPVSHAFHSPLMQSAATRFASAIDTSKLLVPQEILFISTLTAQAESKRLQTAEYWSNQIIQPVQFVKAYNTAVSLTSQIGTIVEIGPSPTLINMAKRMVANENFHWIEPSEIPLKPFKKRLFRNTKLSWNHPDQKPLPPKENQLPENSIYEASWIKTTKKSNPLLGFNDLLILSRKLPVHRLPNNVKAVSVNSKTLLSSMLNSSTEIIGFLSRGAEEDVEIGLKLLQTICKFPNSKVKQVILITQPGNTEDAGLWGLARTFRLERPDIRICCVHSEEDKISEVISIVSQSESEDELFLDQSGELYIPRLHHLKEFNTSQEFSLQSNATYIISGGQGALGLVVAKFLVQKGAKHLLLLSRKPKSIEQIPELKELSHKINLSCLAADVSNEKKLIETKQWLSANNWPEVRGIVHTAGVLADGTIPNQSIEKLHLAYDVKVSGAINLRKTFAPQDFFILFSSAAATFGSAGQASYAASNATLDALALKWSQDGENILSIQWGAWSNAGMAVRHDAVKRAEAGGFGSITNAHGLKILENLLSSSKRGVVLASPIEWKDVILKTPLISNVQKITNGPQNFQKETHKVAYSPDQILKIVREISTEIVGKQLPDNAALLESGLDSLGSVSLRNHLATELNVDLSSAFLFDHPDIYSISKHVLSLLTEGTGIEKKEEILPLPDLPILVIGAGVGGLSFAKQLEKAQLPVVVMEASNQVGGVWHTLANNSSKLQIDSPAYTFDSTSMPNKSDHKWKSTFPSREEILKGCEETVKSLRGPVHLNTKVQKIRKINDFEYEIKYRQSNQDKIIMVSGVISMTGGLHRPRVVNFPKENQFQGHISLGISDDTPVQKFDNKNVLIIGHGAFAVENMRTALEHGAKHVTILCRKRHIVFPTICNWLLNTGKGVMPISAIVDVLRPFYKACGIEIEEMEAIIKEESGALGMDQTTVPAGSDLYFLAQMAGKFTIIVDEVSDFKHDGVLTKNGLELQADIVLKCLGSHTENSRLLKLFGEDAKIQGLWINGDPNLFTYNDGAQVPRKVKSLMCSSYAFFVQAFVPAYLYFRRNRNKFDQALARIMKESSNTTIAERIFVELWDYLEPAKNIVAERTLELCPFDQFQMEREHEWKMYFDRLGCQEGTVKGLWHFLRPSIALISQRNPAFPIETREEHPSLGKLSTFISYRKKILFLPGQGTNARLARTLLQQTGWLGHSKLDFVIPDAPFEIPAFTNEEQLRQIGLDGLVESGIYDKTAKYREWRAGFETLFEHHHYGKEIEITSKERESWNMILSYIHDIIYKHGPFDGIAGFCEGAAVASVALHLHHSGQDQGLDGIQFFIAMSPWRSPIHEKEGMYSSHLPLPIPMLQIVGKNDMEVFLAASPQFLQDFENPIFYQHNGQHVYPPYTPELDNFLQRLLNRSEDFNFKQIRSLEDIVKTSALT